MTEIDQQKLEKIAKDLDIIAYSSTVHSRTLAKYFVFGIFYGLGATVGLAIVLAVLGLILKMFGALPLIVNFVSGFATYLHH